MKLQHFLSKRGVFSRRKSDVMIKSGYVLVNGVVVMDSLYFVNDTDVISFSKKIYQYANQLGYILFHKPKGVWTNCKVTGSDKEVIDYLPLQYRDYASIGRLDKDSEGLILFTNDGPFANQFLNSDKVHERRYLVWTKQLLSPTDLRQLSSGVLLDDGYTLPAKVAQIKGNCYEFILTEGRNRQIRRMVEYCNTHVIRLKRTDFDTYSLKGLGVGKYQYHSLCEVFKQRLKQFSL